MVAARLGEGEGKGRGGEEWRRERRWGCKEKARAQLAAYSITLPKNNIM